MLQIQSIVILTVRLACMTTRLQWTSDLRHSHTSVKHSERSLQGKRTSELDMHGLFLLRVMTVSRNSSQVDLKFSQTKLSMCGKV